ncbi:MAG: hypothetical protein K2X47_03330, partial [Bdellovibrionales bacterium]|nr:hypothetical protein [Bdellovibrionales bacterium]
MHASYIMEKQSVFINLRLKELLLIFVVTSISFFGHAESKSLSENVNKHLKETQWKIDYERDVNTAEARSRGEFPKAPTRKSPAVSTFGVMTHEENPHYDTRESYSPRNKERIGINLNSWAENAVRETQKAQRKNRAHKEAWMKILNKNAKDQGYKVVV